MMMNFPNCRSMPSSFLQCFCNGRNIFSQIYSITSNTMYIWIKPCEHSCPVRHTYWISTKIICKSNTFLGQPVPLWGVLWYAGVLLLGFLLMGPAAGKRWAEGLLALAVTGGILFSAYLTAIELFVLHAVCMWCVVSAVLTVLIFILARPWSFLRETAQAG